MLFLRLGLLLCINLSIFAQEVVVFEGDCSQTEECQQEEPTCHRVRCCRPRYNPEEEELYLKRTEASYPSQREGILQTMTHQ